MEKLAINVKEAARMMGIGLASMYTLVHREDFPVIQVGNRMVIPLEAFRRWLDQAGENKLGG